MASHTIKLHEVRYIALVRYTDSNMWFILEDLSDDGKVRQKNLLFSDQKIAEAYASEVVGFDDEKEKPKLGVNYMVIPVPFDKTIVEEVE